MVSTLSPVCVGEATLGEPRPQRWRVWRGLPVAVRATLVGLAVAVTGNSPWAALALINLRVLPSVPWSVPPAAVYLWLWWRYMGGWGRPRSTSQARRDCLRVRAVSKPVWRWSLWALGFHWAAMTAVGLVARRFVEPTPYVFPEIPPGVSPFTLVCILLMVSVVAGVVEETAFRGYLQVPLERRYGPVAAIALVSLVFAAAHFMSYPGMSLGFFLAFAVSVSSYSIVAYLSGSILPGVVLHAAGNAAYFVVWVVARVGDWRLAPIVPPFSATGADLYFWIDCLEVPVFAVAAVWAYRRLALAAKHH